MGILFLILHVIVCVFLILVILLQAGKGHGLTGGAMGGESTQSLFGTKTNSFMNKVTTVAAILFILTSLGINIGNSWKSKSLILNSKKFRESIPATPLQPAQQVEEPADSEGEAVAEEVESAVAEVSEVADESAAVAE